MGFASAGMKLYVRPKEAMERVARRHAGPAITCPSHPSLAMHELIKKLGNIIPQSPKDVTVMQRRLIRAGIRKPNALKMLYGSKVVLGAGAAAADGGRRWRASPRTPATSSRRFSAAGAVGFFGPNEYVRRMAAQAPARDRARPAQRARSAGGLRGERPGSRSGHSAGVERTGPRAPGNQRGVRNGEPGAESRQAPRGGAAQSGRAHRRRRFEEAGGGADSGRPLRHGRGAELCARTPTSCAFRRARWPRKRPPNWA